MRWNPPVEPVTIFGMRTALPLALLTATLLAACAAQPAAAPGGSTSSQSASIAMQGWKVYANAAKGFSLRYPPTLAPREFPDTKDGAGFGAADLARTPENDAIVVGVYARAGAQAALPFEEYVKIGAIQEIEGYQKLEASQAVVTDQGVTCYVTAWSGISHGQPFQSPPLAICPFDAASTLQLSMEKVGFQDTLLAMTRSVTLPVSAR